MLYDIIQYTDEQIAYGLKRCRAEIKPINGFVTFNLAVLLGKMGLSVPTSEEAKEASALASWDRISLYFQKYIGRNVHGVYGELRYFGSSNSRHITLTDDDQRTLRLVGGWDRFGESWYGEGESLSFLRKDWLSSYRHCDAIEYQEALPAADLKGLMGKIAEWPK